MRVVFNQQAMRNMTPTDRLMLARTQVLPYSEVCVFMRVAGESRPVLPVGPWMAQILNEDGSLFSFPVTRGEAGLTP